MLYFVHPKVPKPVTISGKTGCHGDDEKAVFAGLCDIVEEVIELYKRDGKPVPTPTSWKALVTADVNVYVDMLPMAPLPDDALVVRGGQNLSESFAQGSGVTSRRVGKLRECRSIVLQAYL